MHRSAFVRFILHTVWVIRSYITKPQWRRLHPLLTHPKIVALEIVLIGFWLLVGRGDDPEFVTLIWSAEPYQISDDYFGVAIDAAMLTNGEWWSNSDAPPRPLDFSDPQLQRWTQLLAPDWIRLGGTEADKLWLAEVDEDSPAAPLLPKPLFNDFLNFVENMDAKPFITASTGPLTRKDGQWQPEQLQRLLNWIPDSFNGKIEFGNEPGAHWLIFGREHQIRFDQLADEYREARAMTQQQGIELAGPANAFWPEIGEPLKQLFGSSKHFLKAGANPDIFTWHYYPTQSSRCTVKTENADWDGLLDVETLREFEKRNLIVKQWLKQYSPNSKLWLGETGPAQCGGKAKLTDRFGASLWWLSHLGIAARYGNETIIRQSLVGGDYALLRYNQGYSPNPDFWASVLWQQNMGSVGYPVVDTHGALRAFAHCHATTKGVMAMVIVNQTNQAVQISLPQMQAGRFLDVTSFERTSRHTLVNGLLADALDWQARDLPWLASSDWRALPPYSYRWVQIQGIDACASQIHIADNQ